MNAHPERKITVILAADVAGYSRLVGADEESSLETLKGHRAVLEGVIREHRGRVFARAGDSVVAEFASAVDAVRAAVAGQRSIAERNAALAAELQMRFRIGVHLGDVVVDGEDLLGDGVNIAARLEGCAEPGGVLISAAVYDQVHSKLDAAFDDAGELALKNIARPVRAYRVRVDGHAASSAQAPSPRRRWRVVAAVSAALVVAAIVAIVATWPLAMRPVVDLAGLASLPVNPPLPDKPSIVVLPFANMGGDPAEEYFGDGLAEDLTTDLSRDPNLFVISRSSAFTYKGKAARAEEIGKELGVRYVLEGSARKAGSRVRVNAQLIDATTGFHVWSERYDRALEDIFDVQSEITERIFRELRGEIRDAEQRRVVRRRTADPRAYDAFLRGLHHFERFTRADHGEARRWFQRAAELDPNFAPAWAMVANTYALEYMLGWNRAPELLDRAEALGREALERDPASAHACLVLANVSNARGKSEEAIAYAERAIELSPSFDVPHLTKGLALLRERQPLLALQSLRQAVRLNPRSDNTGGLIAYVNLLLGRTEEAVPQLQRQRNRNPDLVHVRLILLGHFMAIDRRADARTLAREILSVNPRLTAEEAVKLAPGLPAAFTVDLFRAAGLP
jgi:TolB-like protein/class 3 adenylate cyclase/Tfp pilus assembly protein PilF